MLESEGIKEATEFIAKTAEVLAAFGPHLWLVPEGGAALLESLPFHLWDLMQTLVS